MRLTERLKIKQPNVAKLEKRTDIYISTLLAAIEAMGGTLDIVACFPDGKVKITNFSSVGEGETATSRLIWVDRRIFSSSFLWMSV